MTSLGVRLRALFHRADVERGLDDELRYHLERETERNVAHGMTPDAARDAARRAFGNVSNIKEEVRDSWGLGWLEQLRQDVSFALRSFKRAPVFVVTVVATIALALGLNTTAFTIFNAYVLRPIAVRDPYSLYQMTPMDRRGHGHRVTWDQYQDVRALRTPGETFGYTNAFARVDGQPMFGLLVTGEALRVLGADVALGRTLLPEDATTPNGAAVVVLSHDAWRSKFGADSGIIGRKIPVRGLWLTVVGVLSERFQGFKIPPDFWAPITLMRQLEGKDLFGPDAPELLSLGFRLRVGERPEQARAMFATWAKRATREKPDTLRSNDVVITSLANALPNDMSETYLMFAPIFVAFGLVLLIACANVANIMLARGLARQREIGIRLALGAERARLVRQLLTESALLAVPAAITGFLISRWTIDGGVRAMFASLPKEFVPYVRVIPLAPDARVFVFILVAALSAALLFGLIPALQATRPNIVQASRGDFDTAFRPGRLRGVLLVAQITVCALLLITTGILVRGSQRAHNIETGIVSDNVVQVQLEERTRVASLEKLKTHPIVREIAASMFAPLDGSFPTLPVRAEGERRVEQAPYNFVSSSYFSVLGIPLEQGRVFTAAEERDGSHVAVVSAAAARMLFPGRQPVGQLLRIAGDLPQGSQLNRIRTARVVGVARNAVSGWIGVGLDRPVVYYPTSAESEGTRLLARVNGNEDLARRRLDKDIQTAVAASPIEEIHTLNDYLAVQRYPFKAFSWVSSAIGAIALLLTIAGIYGVLSYLVTQRTREIGIRIALGATVSRVVTMVLRQSFAFALLGVVMGAALALGASKVFQSVLVIVDTYDAVGYASGAAVVVVAALVASYAPARRAASVDPLTSLREE